MDNIKLISDDMRAALRKPLPPEAVKPHPTKNYLSSIKAIYVIERLNEVFGIGSWHLRSTIVNDKTSMIVVQSTLTIPAYGIELESFGGNDNGGEGSKNFDLGDAYKGATTDALTKICSFLEIGIDVFKGLADRPAEKKELPWLNKGTKEFETAKSIIQKATDKAAAFQALRSQYQISKATAELLK